ncbi:FecCD family ABC transporter permease [Rhodohalobacter sp. 614A]|uniref:FecCD family ABC transporter permease n=1 Tax=Rhodohalobacter sp. 614A TaxID=2908649 RepID=UPI001F32D017|nr:iron ABC transporter permease [Rhodohalobacter sp. 614A]
MSNDSQVKIPEQKKDQTPDPSAKEIKKDTSSLVLEEYQKSVVWRYGILVLLAAGVLIAFMFDLTVGASSLTIADLWRGIMDPGSVERTTSVIIWEVRFPYSLMAVLVGGALSLSGTEMQTILNNQLASPFTLGVSAAASLGAALAIILNITIPGVSENWIISGNAFLFAFGSVLLLQAMARLKGGSAENLVLLGIAFVFTFNALVALIQFVSTQEALQQFIFWSMGSLVRANWDKIQFLTVAFVLILPFSIKACWKMNALRLGDERAKSFGVNVSRLRFASLFRISILSGISVAFVGTIGFIGLVGPHIARLIIGEDHRFLIPASIFSGAFVMSLASIASKIIFPGVLIPLGIVTSLIGIPIFLTLILSKEA